MMAAAVVTAAAVVAASAPDAGPAPAPPTAELAAEEAPQ